MHYQGYKRRRRSRIVTLLLAAVLLSAVICILLTGGLPCSGKLRADELDSDRQTNSMQTNKPDSVIEIRELRVGCDLKSVKAGVLPNPDTEETFAVEVVTPHITVPIGSIYWLNWTPEHNSWWGFNGDIPVAYNDGSTHYGLHIGLTLEQGYAFADSVKVYFNGEDVTSKGYTVLYASGTGRVIIDLGLATGKNPVVHTVSFNTMGGSSISSQQVPNGYKAYEPAKPTKTDCWFAGWYKDRACTKKFSFSDPITSDTTVYVKWDTATLIENVYLTCNTTFAKEGVLSNLQVGNQTEHIVAITETSWLYWPEKQGQWYSWGDETPVAVRDGSTHYAISVSLKLEDRYLISKEARIYFNGEDVTDRGHTTLDKSGVIRIDLGVAKSASGLVYDFTEGSELLSQTQADQLVDLMRLKIVGFKIYNSGTYAAVVDVDKNGSYDLRCPRAAGVNTEVLASCNLAGTYKIPVADLFESEYPSVTFKFPMAAPTNVKAVSESVTSVKVSWNKVSGASGYQVWRSTSPDKDFVAIGSVTETSRLCPGLTCGTEYYFKVRAYKTVNGKRVYGYFSNVVNAIPKPGKPTDVKAASTSTSSIKVSWSAVSGVSGYQVARSTSPDKDFVVLGSLTELYRSCTGLTCGTKYYFKVRAYKIVDGKRVYGAYSAVVNAIPKPSAPTGVKATVSSSKSVTVSWNKVTGATGYQVWRSTSKDSGFVAVGSVTDTKRECPGLTSGKKYYFKVRAYKEVNGTKIYSAYSTVVSATPK